MNADIRGMDDPLIVDSRPPLLHGDLTERIIGAFFEVYNTLRFGMLESVYANALAMELGDRGVRFEREVGLEVWYKGRMAGLHRADFLVEKKLVVEVKASRALSEADRRQVLHYLRATNTPVALLLHFGPEAKFYRIDS
jgi:hypothetical protein